MERKENASSLNGKTNWLLPGKQHGGHQILTLKVKGVPSLSPLRSCSFKMEGPQTPSSGAAVATAQRQPSQPRVSAEGNKNSFPAHAKNTEAAGGSGVCSSGAPGSSLYVPTDTVVAVRARPRLHLLERGVVCSPRIPGKGGEGRLGGQMTNLQCPFGSAPPFPSLG